MTTVDARPIVDRSSSVSSPLDFDAVFMASHGRMVRTLTLICGDADVAADCVADAFERAYVRWRRVARLDDPVAWIRRVAINRSRDVHRRDVRGRRAVERLGRRTGDTTTTLPDRRDDALLDGVAELPLQQRTVVALHYLDDLSVADVAAAMRLSEGTVKFHLHQARQRLRATIDEPGNEP